MWFPSTTWAPKAHIQWLLKPSMSSPSKAYEEIKYPSLLSPDVLQTSGELLSSHFHQRWNASIPFGLCKKQSLEAIDRPRSLTSHFQSTCTPLCFSKFIFTVHEGVIFLFIQSSEFKGYSLLSLLQSASFPHWWIETHFPRHFLPRPWATHKAPMGKEQMGFH